MDNSTGLEEPLSVEALHVIQESIGYVVSDTVIDEVETRIPFIVSSNSIRLCSVDDNTQLNVPDIIQTLVQQIELLEQHEKITLTALQNANIAFNEMVKRIQIIEEHNKNISQMLDDSNKDFELLKPLFKLPAYNNLSTALICGIVWIISVYSIYNLLK